MGNRAITEPLALTTDYVSLDARYTDANGNPYASVAAAETVLGRRMNQYTVGLTVLVKESGWTEAKEYWVQPKGTTPETYGLVEKDLDLTKTLTLSGEQKHNASANINDRAAVINQQTSEVKALGYKVLNPALGFAEQVENVIDNDVVVVDNSNTIFEIRDEFNLNNGSVTIPANCTLKFNGGKIVNGTLTSTKTKINAGITAIFGTNLTLAGNWNVEVGYPEWFGAVPIYSSTGTGDDATNCFIKLLSSTIKKIVLSGLYCVSSKILNYGTHIIEGNSNARFKLSGFVINSFTNTQGEEDGVFEMKRDGELSFKHVYFNGKYKAPFAVKQPINSYLNLDDCYIERFYRAGVMYTSGDSFEMNNTYIRYCYIGCLVTSRHVDFATPLIWNESATSYGIANHVGLYNCSFFKNTFGVIIRGVSDCIVEQCLFGYNDLYPLSLIHNGVCNIVSPYFEGDFRTTYLVEEDLASDPKDDPTSLAANSDLLSILEDNETATKEKRGYILVNDAKAIITSAMFSNWFIRSYNGSIPASVENNIGIDVYIVAVEASITQLKHVIHNWFTVEINNVDTVVYPTNELYVDNKSTCNSDIKGITGDFLVTYDDNRIRRNVICGNAAKNKEVAVVDHTKRIDGSNDIVNNTTTWNATITKIYDTLLLAKFSNAYYSSIVLKKNNLFDNNVVNVAFVRNSAGVMSVGFKILGYNDGATNATLIKEVASSISVTKDVVYVYSAFFNKLEIGAYDNILITLSSRESNTEYTRLAVTSAENEDYGFENAGKFDSHTLLVNVSEEHLFYHNVLKTYFRYNGTGLVPAIGNVGSARPQMVTGEAVSYTYFDTTLSKPIYWNGTIWVDSNGESVGLQVKDTTVLLEAAESSSKIINVYSSSAITATAQNPDGSTTDLWLTASAGTLTNGAYPVTLTATSANSTNPRGAKVIISNGTDVVIVNVVQNYSTT